METRRSKILPLLPAYQSIITDTSGLNQLLLSLSLLPYLKDFLFMTISYKWLSEYLPVQIDPERLSQILTSIGLEVEKMEAYEEVKGGLKGLVIGEVLEVQ